MSLTSSITFLQGNRIEHQVEPLQPLSVPVLSVQCKCQGDNNSMRFNFKSVPKTSSRVFPIESKKQKKLTNDNTNDTENTSRATYLSRDT